MITNSITHGDCIEVMERMSANSVDFVLTDPPYLVNYRDRSGRSIANDRNDDWLIPAFAQMYRVLKPDSLCVSFCGWMTTDLFMNAWKSAGFRTVGHIVMQRPYASRKKYLAYYHEAAYLLAKGTPPLPKNPPPDVMRGPYTGNRLHPTQKPLAVLKPLIETFTAPGDVVLDPLCYGQHKGSSVAQLVMWPWSLGRSHCS
jgi:site-specific DNA-methyltransferase (adenine-specific)